MTNEKLLIIEGILTNADTIMNVMIKFNHKSSGFEILFTEKEEKHLIGDIEIVKQTNKYINGKKLHFCIESSKLRIYNNEDNAITE